MLALSICDAGGSVTFGWPRQWRLAGGMMGLRVRVLLSICLACLWCVDTRCLLAFAAAPVVLHLVFSHIRTWVVSSPILDI